MVKRFISAVVLLTFITGTVHAQKEKKPVEIINGSSRAVMLMSNYFNEGITKEILGQLDKKTFEAVKVHSLEENYPQCIKDALEYNPADTSTDGKQERFFSTLKMYKIAAFDNVQGGTNFGSQSILVVPAKENMREGGTCNFTEDFYIILNTDAIKPVK